MREFVADVGNTRIKLGEIAPAGLDRTAAVLLDDDSALASVAAEWRLSEPGLWTLAGTHPEARERLARWLTSHGQRTRIISDYRQVPICFVHDPPEQIGLDRLLNAVAVIPKVPRGTPIIVVNAGSAVTVDLIDPEGTFVGGAIFPGFRMMARALHDFTARLPLIESFDSSYLIPQRNTAGAIGCGISDAIKGGIGRLVNAMPFAGHRIFLAGGDAELLAADLDFEFELAGPYLTLEGIQIAARNLS